MRKKLLCTLLTAALLLTLFPSAALADERDGDGENPNEVKTFVELPNFGSVDEVGEPEWSPWGITTGTFETSFYDQLDENSKFIYNEILEGPLGNERPAEATTVKIDVSPKEIDKQDIESIVSPALLAMIYDHPELSWLISNLPGYSYSADSQTQKAIEVIIEWKEENVTIANESGTKTDVMDGVDEAKLKIDAELSSDASTYDKLKAIHDYVCDTVTYASTTGPRIYQTAYSALCGERITVCAGYAKAFKLICEKYGIPCVLVSGVGGNNLNAQQNHMWNYVQIDGAWYAVDCTWDDQVTEICYDYFLAGSNTVSSPGFGANKFNESHKASGSWSSGGNYVFSYPALSDEAYAPNDKPETITITCNPEPAKDSNGNYYLIPEAISLTGPESKKVTFSAKSNGTPVDCTWSKSGMQDWEGITFTPNGTTASMDISSEAISNIQPDAEKYGGPVITVSAYCKGTTGAVEFGLYKMSAKPKFMGKITNADGSEAVTSIVAGGSATYTAKVYDQYGLEMSGQGLKWTLRDKPEGVELDENGKITVANTTKETKLNLVVSPSGYTVQDPPTEEIEINITEKPAVITPIEASWIVDIPEQTYIGKEILPDIALVNGTVTLDGSTDYIVEYSNNVNVGTATVKVTGQGSYSGTVEKNFTIVAAEIQSISITAPTASVYANDSKNTSIDSLKSLFTLPDSTSVEFGEPGNTVRADFNVNWQDPTSAFNKKGGTYVFTGTIATGNNIKPYSGKLEATITVKPVTVKSVTVNATSTTIKASQIDSYELPTAGTIEYNEIADGSVNVNWPANAKDTLKAAADQLGTTGNTTVTLTAASVGFEDWATVPANFAMPTLELTITSKDQAEVSIDNASELNWTYGKDPIEPKASVKIGAGTPDMTKCKINYTGTSYNGTSYNSAETPKDAGDYTVTVTYEDDAYFGSASTKFSIDARDIELKWDGMGTEQIPLTYSGAPATVTASIPKGIVLEGDTCTVTVTGGDKIDAGSYTAKAVLSNKNYKAINDEIAYTIHKGDRGVYVSNGTQDLTSGDPKTLNLYPASGLSKELVVSYTNPDSVDPVFEVSDEATVVRLVSSYNNATITAVGNGHAKVTVSFAETDNFESSSVYFYVEALANPVSQISIGRTDTAASLSGNLDGNTIKVVGLGDPKDICVKLLLATDIVGGLTQDPDSDTIIANGGKISVKDGDNLVAEYTVDLSGVTEVPENTTVTEASGTATAPEGASNELKEAAKDLAPTSSGLVGAAKDLILEAAELAKTEGVDKVKIEASLKVEVKSLDTTGTDKTFRLDVKPVYTISTITDGVESEKIEKPIANEQLSSDVTITVSVKLPDNFPTTNVFARHYKNGAVAEILRVRVNSGMATWEQSSFSEIELFSETRHGSIALKMDDGSQETLSIDAASLGTALPTRTKEGYTFKGWKIGGTVYTTVTDELLTALGSGNALTAEAQFEKNSEPVTPPDPDTPVTPNPPSSSGGGGGGSSSSVSKKISIGKTSNGTISSSHQNPTKGTKVTLTAKPKSGYVLDSLRVLDAKGNEVELTEAGDGKYTFIMPDGKVTVDAKFVEEGSQSQTKDFPFTDAADSWAKDAIAWAYENGYVNGTSGTTFNPDGSITRQQMWMILARLSGASPANMAEAREWAMDSGVTDGTNGGNAMTRQQMVTFLYRYGRLKGYALVGAEDVGELDGFPDSGTVSGYAQVPLAWAVVNGIVSGTSDGTLNPGGGATRAQFAVILQRFYNNIVEN